MTHPIRHLIQIVESAPLMSESYAAEWPAEKALREIEAKINRDLGIVVLHSLAYKMSSPEMHEWPIEGDDILYLQSIEAAEKGVGYGSEMLTTVCDICDRHGVRIYLDASPFGTGGMSYGALIGFYTSFGFRKFPEMAEFAQYPMIRDAGSEDDEPDDDEEDDHDETEAHWNTQR